MLTYVGMSHLFVLPMTLRKQHSRFLHLLFTTLHSFSITHISPSTTWQFLSKTCTHLILKLFLAVARSDRFIRSTLFLAVTRSYHFTRSTHKAPLTHLSLFATAPHTLTTQPLPPKDSRILAPLGNTLPEKQLRFITHILPRYNPNLLLRTHRICNSHLSQSFQVRRSPHLVSPLFRSSFRPLQHSNHSTAINQETCLKTMFFLK